MAFDYWISCFAWAWLDAETLTVWLQHGFYPVLFAVFVIASLGVPIPEDVPLIAAGAILRTHPEVASITGTLLVSLVGIMSGDVILYSIGRRWGRRVFEHRAMCWLVTPQRLASLEERFARHGTWMCFFGRFFVGIRAAMCLTAGVTRFPFWKFFLADLSGAVLSIPLFVGLGYAFAHMMGELHAYMVGAQWILLAVAAVAIGLFVAYEVRKFRRARQLDAMGPLDKLIALEEAAIDRITPHHHHSHGTGGSGDTSSKPRGEPHSTSSRTTPAA